MTTFGGPFGTGSRRPARRSEQNIWSKWRTRLYSPSRDRDRARPSDPLAPFSRAVREWFEASFEAPTDAQARGWAAIAAGRNTLIHAPTGSGKTLAAFLWALDRLATHPTPDGRARNPARSACSTSRRSRPSPTTSSATSARR